MLQQKSFFLLCSLAACSLIGLGLGLNILVSFPSLA